MVDFSLLMISAKIRDLSQQRSVQETTKQFKFTENPTFSHSGEYLSGTSAHHSMWYSYNLLNVPLLYKITKKALVYTHS